MNYCYGNFFIIRVAKNMCKEIDTKTLIRCNSAIISAASSCETEYRYPPGCSDNACDYIAHWEYDIARKDVKFEISSKELGRWTGIGFSRDGQMANSDIYTGWVFEGKAYVTDRFAYGRQLPAIDPDDRQDIYEISGKAEDDIQVYLFMHSIYQ